MLCCTNSDIKAHVERDVAERLKKHRKSLNENDTSIYAVFGFLAYGSIEAPAQQQIELGIEFYKTKRDKQQKMLAKIQELKLGLSVS